MNIAIFQVSFVDCDIGDNSATWLGGGIMVDKSSDVMFQNSVIQGNRAGQDGDGIHCLGNPKSTIIMDQSTHTKCDEIVTGPNCTLSINRK